MIDSLSEIKKAEFQILCTFKKICEENNLRYFLCGGTLLGAIRHKGFIPWDDDIDVTMPYDDYLRFLSIAPGLLGAEYFVQNCETEPNFPSPFTKIRLNQSTFLDSSFAKWHINHGIWIDIFPLILLTDRKYKYANKILKVCKILQMEDLINSNESFFLETYGKKKIRLLKIFYFLVPSNIRQNIHKRVLKYICSSDRGEYYSELIGSSMYKWPKEIFQLTDKVEFEGEEFLAPKGYDKYLQIHYGNYMELPPEEKRVGVHADIIDMKNSYETILHTQEKNNEKNQRNNK